jgi:hypothetical protein
MPVVVESLQYCIVEHGLWNAFIPLIQYLSFVVALLVAFTLIRITPYKHWIFHWLTLFTSSMAWIASWLIGIKRPYPECLNSDFISQYVFPAPEQVYLVALLTIEIMKLERGDRFNLVKYILAIVIIPLVYSYAFMSTFYQSLFSILFSISITAPVFKVMSYLCDHYTVEWRFRDNLNSLTMKFI